MPEDGVAEVKAAHDIALALRNDGYSIGYDSDDVLEDFDEHVEHGQDLLDPDDLGGFFVVAHRDGQTDFGTSVVLRDEVAYGVVQIQMLGAHFRAVHDTLPLDVETLVDAMIDEALTISDLDGDLDE